MKKKHYIVGIMLVIVAVAIITNQLYWIYNMYKSYKRELLIDVNRSLEKAIYQDVTERSEGKGGFFAFSLYTENGDSSRYIEKTIRGADTIFTVSIDRQDPHANLKIAQTVLKEVVPLDVSVVNNFFLQEMKKSLFPIQETLIEYYDLTNHTLVRYSGDRQRFVSYVASDMVAIDIVESIGVKAYVNNPVLAILGGMIFQLILSILLIVVAFIGLFYLRYTIFRQWKEEKMRQDSVNAMTHEFRRPISTAVSLVTLIPYYIEKMNLSKASHYAELTCEELNKLTAYTQRIQQLSNNERPTIRLNKSTFEIRPFMASLINKYLKQVGEQNTDTLSSTAEINLNIRPECTMIYADRIHFANVLDNLIENAIKYSEEKTVIDISVDFQDRYLRISVKDNGIGLSPSDVKHVFEKYYRVNHRLVNSKAGFGLGLTYVKSIIEEHGGSIEVKSNGKEHGCEFVLYISQ